MLPKNKLGRQMATKLKVYKGAQHPHLAQQPVAMDFHASNAPKVLTSKVMVPTHPGTALEG
jgi:large subunit ribosomal protein L13